MSERDIDDDSFHPWHIAGFDQCGSRQYTKNQNIRDDADSFKVLYEHEQRGGSDAFMRIYGSDEEAVKSQQESDEEFLPFKTGIASFDERLAHKGGAVQSPAHRKTAGNSFAGANATDHDQRDSTITLGENGEAHDIAASDSTSDKDERSSFGQLSPTDMERALESGYRDGFDQGKAKGYEEGLSRGMEEGLARGVEEGHQAGFEKGEQEGYDAGFQQGEEDGKVVGDARALEIITSLEDVFQKAEQSWHNTVKSHESKILSLICRIAEKVVFARVELDEGVVKESILNALSTMPEPEEIILNISPDDYEYIEMVKEDFFEHVKSLKSVSVVANPSVTRGGCKIESSKAKVETDIQSRLEQVFSTVMGARLS